MHLIYIILFILHIYTYIYIYEGLSLLGDMGNSPTSQTFAHSPPSWNNFFPLAKISYLPTN